MHSGLQEWVTRRGIESRAFGANSPFHPRIPQTFRVDLGFSEARLPPWGWMIIKRAVASISTLLHRGPEASSVSPLIREAYFHCSESHVPWTLRAALFLPFLGHHPSPTLGFNPQPHRPRGQQFSVVVCSLDRSSSNKNGNNHSYY